MYSIIPLYISKESQAFVEITEAIKPISGDEFGEIINQGSLGICRLIHNCWMKLLLKSTLSNK